MKTFSRVAIAMVGMTGLVSAQPKADPKAAPKAPDAKPADPKAADPKAAGMPEMKPPQELADMAKSASGTWHCKGQGMDHSMKMADMTGTFTMKLDVDNWWMHGSFSSKMGKEPFHFESFTTFDPAGKTMHIHYDKYHDVVGKMLAQTLNLQYQGDKAAADRFIDQYSKWDETLHGAIAKKIRDSQKYRFRLFKYAALGE